MAATIGALMVDIGANVSRLQYDMNRAQGTVTKAANTMARTAKTLAGVLGVSFGVSAMIKAGKQTLDLADKYAKMSRSVGISVESLSALDHVANLSGTSFEKVANSVKRLTANMNDVQGGTGEAKDAFEALNISVVDHAGKLRSSEAVMFDIADRFSEMQDGSKKTALAIDIFGRSGADLITMLDSGSKGIRSMMEEAERLGVTFDTKTANAAERINDQFYRFNQALTGMSQQTIARLLPDIENLSNLMFAAASNAGEMNYAARFLSTTLKLLMTTGIGTAAAFEAVGTIIAAVAAAVMTAAEGDFQSANDIIISGHRDVVSAVEKSMDRINTVWNSASGTVDITKTEIVNNLGEISAETKKTEKALSSYMAESATTTEKYVSSAFGNMESSIVSFTSTGKASFSDFANSVIQDIMRIYVKQQIIGPLMSTVLSSLGATAVSGASSYYGGEIYEGATAGELSSYFSTHANGGVFNRSGIVPFATGGVVDSPTFFPYANGTGLMGEAGPEAIMPLTKVGGKLGVKASGGGNQNIAFTQNLDLRGATASDAKAITQAANQGAEIALAKFKNELKRGGSAYNLTRG